MANTNEIHTPSVEKLFVKVSTKEHVGKAYWLKPKFNTHVSHKSQYSIYAAVILELK